MKRPLLVTLLTALALLAACQDAQSPVDEGMLAKISSGALIVDVRTPEEFAQGHFPGAINIPHEQIVEGLRSRQIEASEPVILYCRSGNRSGKAERALHAEGYVSARNAGSLDNLLAATQHTAVTPGS